MFTVERTTGRLIEARVHGLRSVGDAEEYSAGLSRISGLDAVLGRPILCADHRAVAIYPPSVADRLATLFGQMNDRLARVAVLVAPSNATLAMQLERIVREARNPNRRVFYEAAPASDFLDEVLEFEERRRLAAFLAAL